MKVALLKQSKRTCYLYSGFLVLVASLFLVSANLAQAADTRIAFMSTRNAGNGEIFVMNPDGKRIRQLTRHLEYDAVPAWSPDGKKITFMSFRDEHKPDGHFNGDVYVMNADGTNPINLTNHPKWDSQPSWEPGPTLSVSVKEKLATLWGKVKRNNAYGVK